MRPLAKLLWTTVATWLPVTHVVAFEVEVCEVDGNAVLGRRNDLPDAVLVRRIDLRERRTLNGSVSGVNVTAARVCGTVTSRWYLIQHSQTALPLITSIKGKNIGVDI